MRKGALIGSIILFASIAVMALTLGRAAIWGPRSNEAEIGLPNAGERPTGNVSAGGVESPAPVGKPKEIEIPKLGVNTGVQHVGVTRSGLMAVPTNYTDTGWFRLGPRPGEMGSSVIAGHQDNGLGTPAIFYDLEDLEVGDSVYITDEDGQRLHFKVKKTEVVPYNLSGPKLEEIFNKQGGRYLNLITCAGSWVDEISTNDKRLIVYTELVE